MHKIWESRPEALLVGGPGENTRGILREGGGEEGAERTAIESISGQLRPKIYENWLNNQAGCYLN